ncbi:hypothetical protein MPER_16060 [Moniliophthora perniciosa FA553]|nr:hypothetical protein MPER_16060 [Moniliophthora perniciosa FA553]
MVAYHHYRSFIIIHTLAEALKFNAHTRKLTTTISLGAAPIGTLQDVYNWAGINEGTFANKKVALERLHNSLTVLEGRIMAGRASAQLQAMYREQWEPYLFGFHTWVQSPVEEQPVSLHWSYTHMLVRWQELDNLLGA